jgi:hypothetical protein
MTLRRPMQGSNRSRRTYFFLLRWRRVNVTYALDVDSGLMGRLTE